VPRVAPFEAHHRRYEAWFGEHEAAYISELLALRPFVPWEGRGLEIGAGSGRFAARLGMQLGLDPSRAMLAYAAARGIEVVEGTAEDLPFADGSFDRSPPSALSIRPRRCLPRRTGCSSRADAW
jgi:SAM-dependent methyltransferase